MSDSYPRDEPTTVAASTVQHPALQRIHPDDLPALLDTLAYMMDTPGTTIDLDLRTREEDGSWRLLHATGSSPVMHNGEKTVLFSAHDGSKPIKLERERDPFFNLNVDLLVTATMEGQFIEVNPAWEKVLGYTLQDFKTRPYLDFVHPDDLAKTLHEMQKLSQGIPTIHFRNRYRAKDGSYKWLAWSSTPVPEEGLVYGVARDVTAAYETELQLLEIATQLEQQAKDLQRSNEELEQFAYVASHDLQEPLRMITSYLQLLERRYGALLDEDAREFIDYAVDGATRMKQLINDLLLFSRINTRPMSCKLIEMEQVLEQVFHDMELLIEESDAIITHDPLPVLEADSLQVTQLFQNLIANALKFRSDAAPVIHIGAVPQGEEWLFSVRDNGIGLDPAYADRIFIIFKRLHTRTEYSGTGIGLAICKRIVARHGGTIWVESALGEGTTCFFTLPTTQKAPPHGQPTPNG